MTLKTHFETGIGLSMLIGGMAYQHIDAMNISDSAKLGILGAILIGITAGSVYPDIDLNGSNLNAENIRLQWESNFDHRGIVHTLVNIGLTLPFLLLWKVLSILTPFNFTWVAVLGISMVLGCLWHMVLDSLTPKGIMWLYPLTVFRFRIPIIRNYATERIFRIIVTGILVYFAVQIWAVNLQY